ncbi:hypothetical protein [Phenylobacterium sp.]|jgi:hypothetical protein|uniref:hypothetical protein n=1 Tax=Phenylobacterium sp. TaxID=1871053 RepID=UPI002F959B5D
MMRLASEIATIVRARAEQASIGGSGEIRLIFHGPPLEILEEAFHLLGSDGHAGVPVLLQIPRRAAGEDNPPVGVSGRCDATHLLNLRNSPTRPTYVALVPPGEHSNRSVETTSDEFGMSASNNSGNVPFEAWWADEFVQDLLGRVVTESGLPDEDVRTLAERAASAADEVDTERTRRTGAWRSIGRLFEALSPVGTLSPADRISLACGVPPMTGESLAAREQLGVLEKVADALSEGFGAGISKIEAEEADKASLQSFLEHLRQVCDSPTGFERAPAAYYGPAGLELPPPPDWWFVLTAEKWAELLSEDAVVAGDIEVSCSNELMRFRKGMPLLVEREVELQFQTVGANAAAALLTIERTPAGPAGKQVGQVQSDSGEAFVDDNPPPHGTPIRYVVSAPGFKQARMRIISLASWRPGIFVGCRLATKLWPTKRTKGKKSPEWEAGLLLPGSGRYELVVFSSPGIAVEAHASGSSDEAAQRGEEPSLLAVREVDERQSQVEVEVEGNFQVDISFTRTAGDETLARETCRVALTVEEVQHQGCRSEFERLIRANRRVVHPAAARAVVQLDRNARASSLQDWMLSEKLCSRSYRPVVMAEDYVDAWVQPDWTGEFGPILSKGRFIQDPRPAAAEFEPPAGFVEARQQIASRIRGAGEQGGLVESAELGRWVHTDPEFREQVERYLGCYHAWLQAAPDVASWIDVIAVTSVDQGGNLTRVPEAIMLSPLHPVRIAWQCIAQQVLLEADEGGRPCPAASVLDPDCVPDLLTLGIRAPDGVERTEFLAVENGTDYWSVLWNGRQLSDLPRRSQRAPFGEGFGVSVGGISAGFSAAQVGRALHDVSDLLAAKPLISIAVASAGGTTDACNQGLIDWCSNRYEQDGPRPVRQSVGPRYLDIYDERDDASRPDDATVANLCEDTGNAVRWFTRQPDEAGPDLGIIAQLDMAEPMASTVQSRSAVGHGALIRHRVRRQLPGAFLSESRQGIPPTSSGDVLMDKVGACVTAMENRGEQRTGMRFAPNVNAIHQMLERRKADFVAISSSAVDPACFLGGWLEGTFLWDYDLPSYSHRAGDTNGYYLLSRVKDADREALGRALARLPGCASLPRDLVQDVLLEVARRGIPTIRGLAGDNAGATGDLGMFLAVRLLQDRFRKSSQYDSLLPVIGGSEDDAQVCLVVPVDPFRGYLSDLARSLNPRDASLSRPDLLVVAAKISPAGVRLHLTPVEVKCRPGSVFPASEVAGALGQARALCTLLADMAPAEGQPAAWALAFQHLLLSIIGFGMRVYSQHHDVVDQDRWATFHERIAASILGGECEVTVDRRGRLIVIDDAPMSRVRDHDSDKFDETINIGLKDAAVIVGGDPREFYDGVRAKVGDWGFFPGPQGDLRDAAQPEPDTSPAAEEAVWPEGEPAEPSGPGGVQEGHHSSEQVPGPQPAAASEPSRAGGILLDIGSTVDGFQPRPISLNISDTRLNHMNMGVVGDLGTGKTQLLKSLMTQISSASQANRGVRPRFLIFDYKNDYSDERFVAETGAKVVQPQNLPLNMFDTTGVAGLNLPMQRYLFFGDVLDKIYSGIGPVQRDKLKNAIRSAYATAIGGRQPTLHDVRQAYSEIVDGKSDSVLSIIGDLDDMQVFEADPARTVPFDEFFNGVVVISLSALGSDDRSKNMLVAVMLNLFYENMLRTEKRPFEGSDPQLRAIDSYLLVDEADNIMRYEFDVLRRLLLQGREFGAGVILASQYLRHFKAGATDYREPLLTWFVHKVPNVTPGELSALGLTGSVAELAERVKSLQNHQCLYKSFDVPGEIVRGLPFFELVQRDAPG